jgi:hypothetical protein
MNDVYGIDPSAPSDLRDFAHLMRVFEVDQGRFIADFPSGGWFPEIKQHLKALADVDQMKLMELWLRVGRSALVPTSGRFNPALSWPENAINLRDRLAALVGAKDCPATLTPLDQLLLDPKGFPDASGGHVSRTADAYAKVARPLLQTSPKVVLVDPYFKLRYFDERARVFRPATRFRDSLRALLREAVHCGRVEIFKLAVSPQEAYRDDRNGDFFCEQLDALAEEWGVTKIELEIQELDSNNAYDKHPRYLLGMERGLHFDWGFDTSDVGSTNHVEWISKVALQPLLKRFT